MTRKKNYLNNKDILKQIHISKTSYCSYRNRDLDNQQDFIVEDVSEINDVVIYLAREARAKRLSKELDKSEKLTVADIDKCDVVIRVMTLEHIPLIPKKKPKSANAPQNTILDVIDELNIDNASESVENKTVDEDIILVHTKTNFHPFFVYRVDENNTPYIVGKSHWKGTLEDGAFCLRHGKTSDELAKMYMKLCDRYGTRSNWRGYTYNDEMRGAALIQLIQVGLKFNELKSDNPFAYYTAIVTNSFTRVLLNEKKMQNIRDDILEENGLVPSWTRQQTTSDAKEISDSRNMYKAQTTRIKEENTRLVEENSTIDSVNK
jgi:hypothetical protein